MTAQWKRQAERAEERQALDELARADPRGRERINAWLGQNPDKALIHLAEEVEVAKRNLATEQPRQPALT